MPTYDPSEIPGSEQLYAELTALLAKITGWKPEDIKHICYVIANEEGYQIGGCKHSLVILHQAADQDVQHDIIRAMIAQNAKQN